MSDARDFDPDEKWWREYLGVNELEAENARLRAEREELTGMVIARDGEIDRLRAALRAVRADRPSAHSDAVWQQINDALSERR